MGFIIMCFHSSALTAGMTKKGEISSTRTMPRPGKGSFTSSASSTPSTTVMTITLPIKSSVFQVAGQKSGSVMK